MLARLGGLWRRNKRTKQARQKRQQWHAELAPTLQVRLLEERRVFHAAALAAPAVSTTATQSPPPPPTTTITLDSAKNLLVQDASTTGQSDQLTVRLDATHGRYEIYDPTHALKTDIAGATGSGTDRKSVV